MRVDARAAADLDVAADHRERTDLHVTVDSRIARDDDRPRVDQDFGPSAISKSRLGDDLAVDFGDAPRISTGCGGAARDSRCSTS